jgi:hypothetical protein
MMQTLPTRAGQSVPWVVHRLRSTAAAGQEIALELDTVANQTVRPPALAQHQ